MPDQPDPRSDADELIAFAQQLTQTAPVVKAADTRRRGLLWLIAAPVVIFATAMITLAVLNGGDDAKQSTTADSTVSPSTASSAEVTSSSEQPVTTVSPITTVAATTVAPSTVAPTTIAPTTTVTPSTTAPTTTVVQLTTNPASSEPIRWAEFTGGKVYLRGTVAGQDVVDEIVAKAAAVVGDENVVVEYAIVAGTPTPDFAPLFVRDSALFSSGSTALNDGTRGILDLGIALMNQNPAVTIDIKGHTDSVGSDASNLRLSQERVDAIFTYLVSQGIDPARLTQQALGESQPVATNDTDAGRALNRRVEFVINNLLG